MTKRQLISRRIDQRILAFQDGYRQNMALLGKRGVGKTAILKDVFAKKQAYGQVVMAYVNAEVLDFDLLIRRWIFSLLDCLPESNLELMREDLSAGLSQFQSKFPESIKSIRNIRKLLRRGERNTATLRELFSLTSTFANELGVKIVFVIDEFQCLDRLRVPDPFGLLGKQMMLDKDTMFIVTSSAPLRALDIFKHKLSLLFGNFEVMELPSFEPLESAEFLEKRVPGVLLSKQQKKFLSSFLEGNPAYLTMAAEAIEDEVKKSRASHAGQREVIAEKITSEAILKVLAHELFTSRGSFFLYFFRLFDYYQSQNIDDVLMMRVLLTISCGNRKLTNISSALHIKRHEATKVLQRLTEREVIVKRGSFYTLGDSLFEFWLREVFMSREQSNGLDFSYQEEQGVGTLRKYWDQFQSQSAKDFLHRLDTLLKSFRNDTIELEGKNIRLPYFQEVQLKFSHEAYHTVLAKKKTGSWAFQLAFAYIQEDDMCEFVEELKRVRKVQKRYLIALKGLDQNARLIAQEANMQIWTLETINSLFELYNLPKMMLSRTLKDSALSGLLGKLISTDV